MNLRNTVLTLSLLTATVIAASGCSRGVNVIDFAGHGISSPSEAVTPTENSGDDTIVPENTGTTTTDTGTTADTGTTTGTDPDAQNDPYCPAGWVSQGNPHSCCRIDDPQDCIIVEPGPGGGGRPHGIDQVTVNDAFLDDSTPTPPDSGGTGGGGGSLDDRDGIGCHFQGPTGGRRMKQTVGTENDAEDILGKNDCIMLNTRPQGGHVRERLLESVRERITETVRGS